MRKTRIAGIVLTALLFFGAPLYAGHAGGGGDGRGIGYGERLLKVLVRLKLSDSQKRDIAVMLKRHREEVKTLARRLMEARIQLREEVTADAYDADAIRKACKQVAAVEEEMALLKGRIIGELKGALSAEQLRMLRELRAERAKRMKSRFDAGFSVLDEWIDTHSK